MHLVLAQGARYAVGLAAMWALSRVTPLQLRNATPLAYAATLLPLLLVLAIGTGKHGKHWIDLRLFYFQPSELLKLSLPMMAAWYLDRQLLPPRIGAVLVAARDHRACRPGWSCCSRISAPRCWSRSAARSCCSSPACRGGGSRSRSAASPRPRRWRGSGCCKPYQKDRILTFLNPESDPLGTGWNIIQSKIAIGSGGMTGQGWGQGSQSHLNYLPEHTTDFIFAVLSEEFGWIGVATVLALYLFVVGRCLWIAAEARDGYARLLAGSLGLAFFVYVIVNGGMISGLLPVVGVPMPLLSYGGTAAVSLLAGLGVVMSVRNHRPIHG